MENQQQRAKENIIGYFRTCAEFIRKGGSNFPKDKTVVVGLGLLNAILLIIAIAIGTNCAKVKEGSIHVSHSSAKQLLDELDLLSSNHSDVIEAEEVAKKAYERALKQHEELKQKIEQQRTMNVNKKKHIDVLEREISALQSNISAFGGSCGKCPSDWIFYKSSCYFFSTLDSSYVPKTWPDSRTDCVSRGADLIVIDNKEEQTFVSDSIATLRGKDNVRGNGFWIGLTDSHTEGTWVWLNNVTETEERYWMDGEPNDVGYLGEDCAVAVYSPNMPWKTRNDGPCTGVKIAWLCEMTSN